MKKSLYKNSGEASRKTSRKSSRAVGVKETPAPETASNVPDAAAARENLADPENWLAQGITGSHFATKQDLWETKTELKQDLVEMEGRFGEKFATKQDLSDVKSELSGEIAAVRLANQKDLFDMERRLDEKLASKEALAGVEKRLNERLDEKTGNLASKEALSAVQEKVAATQGLITEIKRDMTINFRWTVGIIIGAVASAQIPLYIKIFFFGG